MTGSAASRPLRLFYEDNFQAMVRLAQRGGNGPEQPEWDDVETYSPEWYRRFRDWHRKAFPAADAVTRANLDMLVRASEASHAAR